ncbi:MAG TPA: AAA domain-containing protein [Acidobacteriaceae bacterium]|jgi:very-short-patch-repair endonuclease|nr:AAA domain-containing protein [Acidobacteriaceae bacterium]
MPKTVLDNARETLIKTAQAQWVSRLIDLTRRNNLLYYRPLQTGTLELSLRPDQIALVVQGNSIDLRELTPREGELRAGAIREIGRKALENLEEKGLNTLYLALGKATWQSDDGGRPPEAPVVLLPIALKSHGQDTSRVTLHENGPLTVNPVLAHVLKNSYGVQVDGELLGLERNGGGSSEANGGSEGELDIAAILDILRRECAHIPQFGIQDFAVIGNFSFQKLAMVNDLQGRLGELIASDTIAAIAGDAKARLLVGGAGTDVDPRTLDSVAPENEYEVVEADSSQKCAIAGVACGQNAVIHGPPGTGKSQTITNLIATLTARGKKVLFVAEKRAALEVVMARLRDTGLDHLAVDLHGADLSAKKVMEKVAHTLQTVREAPSPDCSAVHSRFTDRRGKLNEHSRRMHKTYPPANQSVFQLQAQLLRLPPGSNTPVRWRGSNLLELTSQAIDTARDLLRDAAGFESLFLRTDSSPWNGIAFSSGESVQDALELADTISTKFWPQWSKLLDKMCSDASLKLPITWDEAQKLQDCVGGVQSGLDRYRVAVFSGDTDALVEQLERAKNGGLKAFFLRLTDSRFRRARRAALEMRLSKRVSVLILYGELTELRRLAKQWEALGQQGSSPRSIPAFDLFAHEQEKLLAGVADLHKVRPIEGWPNGTMENVKRIVDSLATDSVTPYKLLRLTEIESRLCALGIQTLLAELRKTHVGAEWWEKMLQRAWLSSTLDVAAATDPYVRGFIGSTHSEYVNDFRTLDRSQLQMATARVQRAHAERAIAAMNAHPEQERLIRQEAAKSMRHRSIRRMFKEAGDVLTAVCPCWMASPLSVSQAIDGAAGFFDFVIFDEASQVLPEDAIPAILRGKHVVVAGDNKQLPPTTFFASGDDADLSDEDDTSIGYESLLDMMIPFVKGFHLNWHYRSRDEALIAFSNHHIYDDRLVTFPGPGGTPAIKHIPIDHIPQEDGQEASSSAEVSRVVELILEHARNTPDVTLGVITMGVKHAQRIQAALDHALAQETDVSEFFDSSRHERFFVKNLERVQGDERDAIILSVGYGKDRAGNLPLRFGPILYEGGRRRLNVAVTRARRTVTVVSSFVWSDIDASKVRPGSGLDFLRNYLEYAASGGKIFSRGELTDEPMNDFEADVAEALAAKGITCVPQVGCSKFRIDLAALHPSERGRFVMAIECDGATYHSSYTARDRDRLRQQQLESLGWTFHRIWSTDWFLRKDGEVERAVKAYTRALERIPQFVETPRSAPAPQSTTQSSRRSSPSPPILKRGSIDEYSVRELLTLVEWVMSDGRLRSNDEIADEMFLALPFARRGSRIESALRQAIAVYSR